MAAPAAGAADSDSLWVLAEPEWAEPFVPARIVGERADGTLRVMTAHGERIVRVGEEAWPRGPPLAHEPADLCACAELHTVRASRTERAIDLTRPPDSAASPALRLPRARASAVAASGASALCSDVTRLRKPWSGSMGASAAVLANEAAGAWLFGDAVLAIAVSLGLIGPLVLVLRNKKKLLDPGKARQAWCTLMATSIVLYAYGTFYRAAERYAIGVDPTAACEETLLSSLCSTNNVTGWLGEGGSLGLIGMAGACQ